MADESQGVGPSGNIAENYDERDDKQYQNQILFHDLSEFQNKMVRILLYGGLETAGKLVEFDEATNCILEGENGESRIVLGHSILGICLSE